MTLDGIESVRVCTARGDRDLESLEFLWEDVQ